MGPIDADRLRHEPVGSRNQLTLATRAVQVPSLKAGRLVRSMLCVTLCAVVVQASMNLAMNLQLGGTCIESTYVRELSFSEGGTKESTKDRASPWKVLHLLELSQEHGGSVIIARRRYL